MTFHPLKYTLIFLCLSGTCYGEVLFSSLQKTLVVHASPKQGEVLNAGKDKITVTWRLNLIDPPTTAQAYEKVEVKLCFAPISQKDRPWRQTKDELKKDKTCHFTMTDRPYDSSKEEHSFEWLITEDVASATYFVRVYAFDSSGNKVAYGQTTDDKKSSNLFEVHGIKGSSASITIAASVFSALSILAWLWFVFAERRNTKRFQRAQREREREEREERNQREREERDQREREERDQREREEREERQQRVR